MNVHIQVDGPHDGETNMAVDLALLQLAEERKEPGTWIRFYRWHPPAVSIGRNQDPAAAVDLEYCRRRGIPVVRRPTGGRAVFHQDELTYAVATNDPLLVSGGVGATYRRLAAALSAGLFRLGLEAGEARGGSGKELAPRTPSPCFAAASRHELLVAGRKIAGSAQCRLKYACLQHGSVPLSIDYAAMAAILGCPEDLLRRRMISCGEALGRAVGFEELAAALRPAFQATLAQLEPAGGGLTGDFGGPADKVSEGVPGR